MLTESDVIAAVCDYLRDHAYRVTQQLTETEAGDDIIAVAPDGQQVMIEAKGETSSKSHTTRYGKPFSPSQVLDHVSKAFYRAAIPCQPWAASPEIYAHGWPSRDSDCSGSYQSHALLQTADN